MKKILGLDLGTTSIGWALVNEAETKKETSKIIKTGVRIIPLTVNEKDEFSKGNKISTNSVRTQKRGARRNNDRFKQRRDKLLKLLVKLGFITNEKEIISNSSIELYKLRAFAVEQKLKKNDLAKVLFLLNTRRGYKSNRKTNEDENDSEYLSKISDRDDELIEKDITIGQKFYELLQINPIAKLKDRVYSRQSYINEFEKIWNEQSKYYPELTDSLKKIIKDKIIFYQRDLKSQKGLLSHCEFEPKHKVVPISSPLFQEFRIWQRLHDLVIKDRFSNEYFLNQEEKEYLFDKLQENVRLTDKKTLIELGYSTKEYTLNFEKIEGNTTRAELLNLFDRIKYDTSDILDLDITITGNQFDKQPFMQLWHLIYSAKDTNNLIKNLKKKFLFTEDQAKEISKITYRLNYGSLSSRAIRKILPLMQQGYNYTSACEKVGYRHSGWITKEEKQYWEPEKLELVKKNSLRNPVVEKIINQLINLINAIVNDNNLGRPDEIRIEMARELKMNAKKRKQLTKRINDSTKKHEKIRAILKNEFNIPKPSRNDIIKYKLAEETNWVSLYSGNPIKPSRLFTQDFDIEHIMPKSRLFDDSFLNKTLCESKLNREKGNKTAYDYMKTKSEEAFNKYISMVKENKQIYQPKKDKLLMTSDNIPEDFINRQLSETQFIAKKAKELLTKVSKDVTVTSGSVTDLLKEQWELPFLIQDLNLDKYRSIGQTEVREIKTNGNKPKQIEQIFLLDKKGEKVHWGKRDDHRHHALDAIVVALTKQNHIQHLNTLNATFKQRYQNDLDNVKVAAQKFEIPWSTLREDVKAALDNTLISFKQKNKVVTKNINKIKIKKGEIEQVTFTPRGQLHEETVYGKIKILNKTPKPLNKSFNLEKIDLIVDDKIRVLVKNHLSKFGNNPVKAFDSKTLKNNPILFKEEPLQSVQCYEEVFGIRKPIDDTLNVDNVIDEKVKKILQERLQEYGGNKKKAFSDLENNPIYLNEDKNIEIKRVKIKARLSELQKLERGYVNPGNNHHIAIYKDENEKIYGEKVTFFEAVERQKQNLPIVKKQHELGYKYLFNLQINDYFVFFDDNITPETDLLDKNNYALISKNLFRVQKLSIKTNGQPSFVFRHHLETTLNNDVDFAFKELQSYGRLVGQCQKVQINNLGKIIKIGEY
ncbi:MAG: type II CRISPR RNA-guided endonuclease Cas9 [Flavobacteriaceae bacterium]|nr:type II CRISPR RNA-guided endonuclease Cas9 [Flavobacteriaceae bacterium]